MLGYEGMPHKPREPTKGRGWMSQRNKKKDRFVRRLMSIVRKMLKNIDQYTVFIFLYKTH